MNSVKKKEKIKQMMYCILIKKKIGITYIKDNKEDSASVKMKPKAYGLPLLCKRIV